MTGPASRRGFLKGLTVLSASAAAVAPTLVSAAAPPTDQELLALGRKLTGAVAELDRCQEAMAWSKEHFAGIRPEIPEELKTSAFASRWFHSEWPPNAEGHCDPSEGSHRIRIPCRVDLDRVVKATDGRTVVGKRARRMKRLSDAFHLAHDEARQAAGLPQAAEERHWAVRAVIDTGFAIMAIEAKSLSGLAIKGRAGIAMHRAWEADGTFIRQEPSYASLCANLAVLDPAAATL